MSFKKISGVLLDLNETEHEVFARLLELAETHLEHFGCVSKGDGRYESKVTSRAMAMAVIKGLREELDLSSIKPVQVVDVEEWRRERALKADHHHTNKRWVLCAYDRCNERLQRANGVKAEHPWVRALKEGWKPLDWLHYGRDGFSETLGRPSEDLICSNTHDEHGCPIYDGPQDCQEQ